MDDIKHQSTDSILVKTDCRLFDGAKPCEPNKTTGAECESCDQYDPVDKRILVIKLDAMGDVLRTTFLLPLIKRKWPHCHLTWLTGPESVSLLGRNPLIDEILIPSAAVNARLQTQKFFAVISLSNDHASAAYTALTNCDQAFGYQLSAEGGIRPLSAAARYWLELAVFDRLRRQNTRSYQDVMCRVANVYEMVDKTFPRPGYGVDSRSKKKIRNKLQQTGVDPKRGLIGINVGSGGRWPKKMLPADRIVQLIRKVKAVFLDKTICLLGGRAERDKIDRIISQTSGVVAPDTSATVDELGALVAELDLLISGDTLALHLASALKVPCVALFGPTSLAEIFDYEGAIIKIATDQLDCLGCYGDCDKKYHCMQAIDLAQIVKAVKSQLMGHKGPHLL